MPLPRVGVGCALRDPHIVSAMSSDKLFLAASASPHSPAPFPHAYPALAYPCGSSRLPGFIWSPLPSPSYLFHPFLLPTCLLKFVFKVW